MLTELPSPPPWHSCIRKAKLIDAIHRLQPARLTTAFFKQEGMNILSQIVLLGFYLDASPGGSSPDPDIAAKASAVPQY